MLKQLVKQSKPLLLSASLPSTVHGICSVLLLAQISSALTNESDQEEMSLLFVVTALSVMLSHITAAFFLSG